MDSSSVNPLKLVTVCVLFSTLPRTCFAELDARKLSQTLSKLSVDGLGTENLQVTTVFLNFNP